MIRRSVVLTEDAPATTTSLVVTVMGPDRPGIVRLLSDRAQRFGANWAASRLSRLAGEFAGMVHFEVPRENAEALADVAARARIVGPEARDRQERFVRRLPPGCAASTSSSSATTGSASSAT